MKKLYPLSLCLFALLALVACGENWYGSSSGDGSDVKSLRIDAENAFRDGKFKKSYEICEKIVRKDPTSSFGYYGMAKAGLWQYGISPLSVFSLIKPEKEGECPFMGEDLKTRNNYLQAMRKVFNALNELNRRDSLTVLWEFHEHGRKNRNWDSTFIITIEVDGQKVNKEVDLDERLSDFRKTFCGNSSSNDCSDTTSTGKKKFPLSDREFQNGYFGGVFLLSSFSQKFLNLFDTNNDGCITRKRDKDGENPATGPGYDYPASSGDWAKWGCAEKNKFDSPILLKCETDPITKEMKFGIDYAPVMEDLKDDLDEYYACVKACKENCDVKCQKELDDLNIADINDKIDNFEDLGDILNSMGIEGGEIEQYKAYASFYKIGVHRDVDGDGCIDEELLDGQDNDGDGLTNENSRLSSTDPEDGDLYGISPMNNSMYGNNYYKDNSNWEYNKPKDSKSPVSICNVPNCSKSPCTFPTCTLLLPDETGWVRVLNFTQKSYPDGTGDWTSNNPILKLDVAQDKNCKKYNLEYRKTRIGGCWPWYSQTQFEHYCNLKE